MFFNPERIISSQSLLFLIYFTQSAGTAARLGATHSSFSYITANLTHQPCYTMGYSFCVLRNAVRVLTAMKIMLRGWDTSHAILQGGDVSISVFYPDSGTMSFSCKFCPQ